MVDSVNLVLFWLVPIFYSFDDVDPGLSWLYEINPVAAVILVMRRILLYGVTPGATLLKLAAVSLVCRFMKLYLSQARLRAPRTCPSGERPVRR